MKSWVALALALPASAAWAGPANVVVRSGQVRDQTIAIPPLMPARAYSLSFSVAPPAAFGSRSRVEVSLAQGSATLLHKTLHVGDSGLFAVFHAAGAGPVSFTVSISSPLSAAARYRLQVSRWPEAPGVHRAPSGHEQLPAHVAAAAPAGAGSVAFPPMPEAAGSGQDSGAWRRRKAQVGVG